MTTARQRFGLDEAHCLFVLELLQTGVLTRDALRKSLVPFGLTEVKFSILVTLFTLDPDPAMEADLANHAGVTRPSTTYALNDLQEQGLVVRVRSTVDHRVVNVHLTKKGHTMIDAALRHYLQAAEQLARFVDKDAQAAAAVACARLRLGANCTE
jgi:DNA-binding MarR family transcriptional regulator